MIKISTTKFDDDTIKKIEKALCAWFNSTFVVAYLRLAFTTEEGSFGHIYKWLVGTIPIPDISNEKVINYLADVFQKYKDILWVPFEKQFRYVVKNRRGIRLEYDLDIMEGLSRAYNIPANKTKWAYDLINFYSLILTVL